MANYLKYICLVITMTLQWGFGLSSHAQNINKYCQTVLSNYSYKDYKAYRQNWDIAQSPTNKFMYFANSKGLLEYDGATWRLYELPNKKTVRSLFIYKDGKVFTGALGEFGFWESRENKTLKYVSLNHLIKDKAFDQEEIWNILETPEGVLFQSFAYMYLYNGKSVDKIQTPGNILYIFKVNDKFYLNVIDKGLYQYTNKTFKFIQNSNFLRKESVTTILPYGQKDLLLVGTQKKLYIYNGIHFTTFNQEVNRFLTLNQLNTGLRLANGNYAFGTILNGFIITQPDGQIIGQFNKKTSLQNNTVLALNTDHEGNLWIGLDTGISLLPLSSPFKYFEDINGERGTIFDAKVFENKLFLATNHGVYFLDLLKNDKRFNLLPQTQGYTLNLKIIGNELICGHNKGTFSIKNLQSTLLSTVTGGSNIQQLSNHKDLYLQGTYTNLCLYQKNSSGVLRFLRKLDGFSAPVKQLIQIRANEFLLNTLNNGLQWIKTSDDLVRIEKISSVNKGLEVRNIIKIEEEILVCTKETIRKYENQTHSLKKEDKLEALGYGIKKIFNLQKLGLWFLKDDLSLGQFRNNQWIDLPIKKDSWVLDSENLLLLNNTILFCKENGFEVISTSDFRKLLSAKKTAPFVRAISIGTKKQRTLYFDKSNTGNIDFRYDENTLKFSFCSPSFSDSNHFQYKLENYSEQWSNYTENAEKEFINLPLGHYHLYLKSDYGTQISILEFTINAPWYWNNWSKLLYFTLLVFIFYTFYILHLNKLKKQNEKLLEEKQEELYIQEEKNKQEIIKLRNEQLEQDVIRKSEELADSTIKLIKKNELLKKIKEDVEMLNSSKSNAHILKLIDTNLNSGHDWQLFEKNFNKIHEEFFKKLLEEYPELSQGDIKLCAYLKMNLSSKEISQLLNITYRSVELKRYRLRQKLKLPPEINLSVWLMSI
jgi:ligand-binding sensor domain-containing protein